MVTLTLTPEEIEMLSGVLESYLGDLHTEIHHTDNREFRAQLKARQEFLHKLLAQLETTPAAEGAQATSTATEETCARLLDWTLSVSAMSSSHT